MRIIIDGIDNSGKSTIANYISKTFEIPYKKIRKTVDGKDEFERTQNIINEISDLLGDWHGVLDRGFYSAAITGMAYGLENTSELICPPNLVPDIGLMSVASKEILNSRLSRGTIQDLRIAQTDVERVQNTMSERAQKEGFYVVSSDQPLDAMLEEVNRHLDKKIAEYVMMTQQTLKTNNYSSSKGRIRT